jgi:hypothetical protein
MPPWTMYKRDRFFTKATDVTLSISSLAATFGSAITIGGTSAIFYVGGVVTDITSYARSGDTTQLIPSFIGNPFVKRVGKLLGVGGSTVNAMRTIIDDDEEENGEQ